MDKDNSFRRAFYHLKMSEDYFLDVVRQFPLTIGGKAAKRYGEKISWCLRDFSTSIDFPSDALQGFKEEINGGDLLFHAEISRKMIGLSNEQKESIEKLVDMLIEGEEITYEIKPKD